MPEYFHLFAYSPAFIAGCCVWAASVCIGGTGHVWLLVLVAVSPKTRSARRLNLSGIEEAVAGEHV